MIAKVLSGYKPKAAVPLQELSSFDSQTLESIDEVQRNLFAACYQLETEIYNVNKKVLDVLTACVVRHYPLLKNLSPQSPAVKRIEICVTHAGHSLTDLLAWSTHLTEAPVSCKDSAQDDKPHIHHDPEPRELSYEQKVIDHQAAVIKHLIESSSRQNARMDMLEAKMSGNPVPPTRKRVKGDEDADDVSKPKKKQSRGSATDLHATWFTWYAHEPRWQMGAPKQQRSKSKLLVAFMKLFLADGFALDPADASYRDRVLELGNRAENAVLIYRKTQHGVNSRGSSAVLKQYPQRWNSQRHHPVPSVAAPDSGNPRSDPWLHTRRSGHY